MSFQPFDPTGQGVPLPVPLAAPQPVPAGAVPGGPYAAAAAFAPQVAAGAPAAQYYAQPPGAFAPAPAVQYGGYFTAPAAIPDEVRTIFVTGFPDDVKERELNNLLRFLPGYEASQLHFRNGQAQGFALFTLGSQARAAVDALHNLVFDDTAVLRAEMAHKNMYLKDDGASKRSRPAYEAPHAGPPAYGVPPGAPAAVFGGPPPPSFQYATTLPTSAVVPPTQPRGYAQVTNTKDNPPCNTLFIGNLGDNVNETELRGIFSHQQGFRQLKLVRGPRGVSCFIEFADIPSATAVHDSQQGAILTSSDRGGIRIQYSKNPFGRKRDSSGNYVVDLEPGAAGGAAGGQPGLPGMEQSVVNGTGELHVQQ